MMDVSDPLLQLGVGIAFVYFALALVKEVLAFIKGVIPSRAKAEERVCADELCPLIEEVRAKVSDLHKWHNVVDPRTGSLVWYSSFADSEFRQTLASLGETLRTVAEALRNVVEQQKEERAEIARVREDLAAIRTRVGGGREG